jgi:hypothetical protein
MFVAIEWEKDALAVPLVQRQPMKTDDNTAEAVADWHYWIAQGREF